MNLARLQQIGRESNMENTTVISGARAEVMAKMLQKFGAVLIEEVSPNKFIFIDDDNFSKALSKLQIELRQGLF